MRIIRVCARTTTKKIKLDDKVKKCLVLKISHSKDFERI